jgi:molybdate-binding protein
LFQERYDLIIPLQFYEDLLVAPLLQLLKTTSFQQAVSELPGYDVTLMGTLIARIE